MDNLEMQKQVMKLGKLFVEELKLEPGSDTFSKWMAFYLAEKMKRAEITKGGEKDKAEKECFDIILNLWKHRWSIPYGRRPLEDFEPILNFLQKLNPEKEDPYFFALIPNNHRDQKNGQPENGSPEFWIRVAEQIDRSARVLLEGILNIAGEAASNTKTAEWLTNAVNLPNNHDTEIIRIIVNDDTMDDDGKIVDKDFNKKYKTEKIKSRIEHLENLTKLSELLIQKLQEDLSKIE